MDALFDPDTPPGAPAETTLTVAELSRTIRRLLDREFGGDLWISGQIRNLSVARSGHTYLDLVEPVEMGRRPEHVVSVTLFKRAGAAVRRQLAAQGGRVELEDGLEVRIGGGLTWYAPNGRLQFNMERIDPAFTLGRLQEDRDRLLRLLHTEGLLTANRRHPVPLVPLRIGIVTSETSAAAADVLKELHGSGFAFDIRLVDARTQGVDCGPSVVSALRRLANEPVDVVLLVRGGGARTDLVGFDGEDVARAVAAMPVPVFTGIGHEIDRSIADEVAHTAFKTPTAAAGALVTVVATYLEQLDTLWGRAARAALVATRQADAVLIGHRRRLLRTGGSALARTDERITGLHERIVRSAARGLHRADDHLDARRRHLVSTADRALTTAADRLAVLEARVSGHDPAVALARGWSITTTADGRLVRDPAAVAVGSEIVTRVAAGRLVSTVTTVRLDEAAEPSDPDPTSSPTDPAIDHPSSDDGSDAKGPA